MQVHGISGHFHGPLPDLPTDFGCQSIFMSLFFDIFRMPALATRINSHLSSMNRKRPTSPEINVLAADTPGKPQRKSGAGIPVLRRSPGDEPSLTAVWFCLHDCCYLELVLLAVGGLSFQTTYRGFWDSEGAG